MLIEEITNQSSTSKYRESYSEKYGRYLVAAKKIAGGEVILREMPVAVGAASFNDNCLCFACLRVIPKTINVNFTFSCSGCKLAVFCSTLCQSNKLHHSPEECNLFKERLTADTFKQINMKNILLPLRLLLLKKRNEVLWQKILKLEAHCDARRNSIVWREREENVIDVLKVFKLIGEHDDVNNDVVNDLLQQVCGIIDVNSFELRSPGSWDTSTLRGVYLEAAMMAHDCRGNTYLAVDEEFQLTIYASQAIDEEEAICFNYTSSLLGTAERRAHLLQGKYFICDCKRCEHPEELEANLSTLLCPRCKKGHIRFEGSSSSSSINGFYSREKDWKCKNCERLYSGLLIKTTLELAKTKIDELEDNSYMKELEGLLKSLSLTFHSNHFLILSLKQRLLELYRKEIICLNPKKQTLLKIIQFCKEVLDVLEIVEPGLSRLKGIMLYELHIPTMILASRKYTAREINHEELIKNLEEAAGYLKKSLSMLLLEPPTTPEGLLAKRGLQDLKSLRQSLDDVKSLPSTEINGSLSDFKGDKKKKIKNNNNKR